MGDILTNCLILSSHILGKAVRKENGTQRPEAQLTAQKIPLRSPSDCLITIIERCIPLGTLNRALRNISRRKIRALLVIIALGFSMAILVTIPAGVLANQQTASNVTSGLSSAINQTGQTINQTLSQIDVLWHQACRATVLTRAAEPPVQAATVDTVKAAADSRSGGGGGGGVFFRQFGAGQPSIMNAELIQ